MVRGEFVVWGRDPTHQVWEGRYSTAKKMDSDGEFFESVLDFAERLAGGFCWPIRTLRHLPYLLYMWHLHMRITLMNESYL